MILFIILCFVQFRKH